MCGPLLAANAQAKNLVYSMAMAISPPSSVNWSTGSVRAASSSPRPARQRFEPRYGYRHRIQSGASSAGLRKVATGDFNPKMYNSVHGRNQGRDRDGRGGQRHGLDCPDDGSRSRLPVSTTRRCIHASGGRRPAPPQRSRRYRCKPGAGRPRGVQQDPLRCVRDLQSQQRIHANGFERTDSWSTSPDGMGRCGVLST